MLLFFRQWHLVLPLKNHSTVITAALSNSEKWLYCWSLIKPELFFFFFFASLDLVLQQCYFSLFSQNLGNDQWFLAMPYCCMSCSSRAKIPGLDQHLYHLLAFSLQKGPWGFYIEELTAFVMQEKRKDSEVFQASGWLQTQLPWRGHPALSLSTDSELYFQVIRIWVSGKKKNVIAPYLNLETVWLESIRGIVTEILIPFTWDHSRY